jgi:LacI family transcriptional regulator
MDKVDLRKLASELNLSVATVSKALRDSYEIKEETKQRVRLLADKLNYQPNLFASNLRQGKSRTIAVVIPEIASNFFALVTDGIQAVAEKKRYHVLTYATRGNYENEMSTIKHLENGRVDGLLISLSCETQGHQHLNRLKEAGIEIVFFDRVSQLSDCPTVTTDDYTSAYKATEHLIQNKCKRIAFLSLPDHISINQNRKQGYIDALKSKNKVVDNRLIIPCVNEPEKDYLIVRDVLSRKNPPDGIFAVVEKLAIATYNACNDLKIKIPRQLKIITFSNLPTASLVNPSMSTITQPAFEMGMEACALLFRRIEKKYLSNKTEHIVLKSNLIARKSTAK